MIPIEGQPRMQISRPNANVVMGCVLSTSLTVENLKRCLGAISQGHPLVTKLLTIQDEGKALLEEPKEIGFQIVSYENHTYEQIAEKHLKDEWRMGAPLIKFIINKLEMESQLIVCCHHAICDGLSLIYLMEDIAGWFKDGQAPKKVDPMLLHPLNLKKKFATWPFKLVALLTNAKWKKHHVQLTSNSLSQIYATYWKNHDARVSCWTFDREQTQALIETAKKNKVTVNTYLTHLLYQCQMSLTEKSYRDQIIPSVSLRDQLKTNPLRQLGYFVTATRLDLSNYSPTAPNALTDLQRRIKKLLNMKSLFKTLAVYFFDGQFFDLLLLNILQLRQDKSFKKMAAKHRSVKASMAITNLGLLDKSGVTRFLPLALVSDSFEKYVSFFTHEGYMTMAICYDSTLISTIEIDTFRSSLVDKVNAITS